MKTLESIIGFQKFTNGYESDVYEWGKFLKE